MDHWSVRRLGQQCECRVTDDGIRQRENHRFNMATQYNSTTTIDNAHQLAKRLGIECRDGMIQSLVTASEEVLKQYITQDVTEFALENIQARIRGSVLSAVSQLENGVIINNGNKVEMALGYCTLYGDTIGSLAPLGV